MLAQRETHADDRRDSTDPPGRTPPFLAGFGREADLPPPGWYRSFKRAGDFVLAGLLLVGTAPLILLAGVLVKLTSRGPIIYSQVRLGLRGRPFTLYKIRTMVHDCERTSGPRWAAPGDERVTAVGRFLRRTHLDELPQLWNVLRGDMSLVGPRPERPEFVPQLEKVIPHYRQRMLVPPGLTGLAQVQLPPDTDLSSVRRKLAYDLHYVKSIGLWLDVRIVLVTVCHVLGLPLAFARLFFRPPQRERIELAYQTLAAENGVAKTYSA